MYLIMQNLLLLSGGGGGSLFFKNVEHDTYLIPIWLKGYTILFI